MIGIQQAEARRLVLDTIDAQWHAWNIRYTADMIPVQMRKQGKINCAPLQVKRFEVTTQRLLKYKVRQCLAKEEGLIGEVCVNVRAETRIVQECSLWMAHQHGAVRDIHRSQQPTAHSNPLRHARSAAAQKCNLQIRQIQHLRTLLRVCFGELQWFIIPRIQRKTLR